jgi:Na+-driven multidrug efflux pump
MSCLSLTLLLCMPVAILAAFYAAPISQILFPRHPDLCRRVIQVTVWVLPLFGIECVVGYALNAAGKDSIQAHLGVPIGVCSVLLAAILVWRFGVTGACWSFVLRPAISVGFSLPAFIKTFSPKLSDLPVVGILGCSATMASAMMGARYVLPVVQPPGPAHEWGFSIASLTIQTLVGITAYGISLVAFRLVRLADIARLGAEMIS